MAESKKSTQSSPKASGKYIRDSPLLPNELITYEAARIRDRVAVVPQPSPARRGLVVSALGEVGSAHALLRPTADVPGGFTADSRARLIAGAVGRSGQRIALPKSSGRVGPSAEAHRPTWVEHSFLPRGVPPPAREMLRRRRGGRVHAEKVYGDDDRGSFWPGEYPWNCTGRVFGWTDPSYTWTTSGAGVLVGPRHVLTAGHICPWGAKPWMMLFVPGYFDGKPVPGLDSYVSDFRGVNTDDGVSAWDFAILRLYDPLGDQLGWFGAKNYLKRWQDKPYWQLIGYPAAIAGSERPSWQSGISALDDDADGRALEIEHHGDTSDGNSGGPLFGFWPDGFPYVIGAHSGFDADDREENNIAAGGTAMVELIRWAKQNLA